MQLVCPAGNLPALRAAIDAGADAVYTGFRDQTNARAFPGLNFDERELRQGIAYAHALDRQVYVALNTYPDSVRLPHWQAAVDRAAELGVDAIIAAEMGVLDYACRTHPQMARHLSVQGSATTEPAAKYAFGRIGFARAGLAPPICVAPGIGTINVTKAGLTLLGDGYVGTARDVLHDMHRLIVEGAPPDRRFGLRPMAPEKGERYWLIGA